MSAGADTVQPFLFERPAKPAEDAPPPGAGRIFPIIVLCALGVAVDAVANALSRTGHGGGEVLFWLAVALIVLPAALRLFGERVSTSERLLIVVVVGLALYALKVLLDPFAFTFGDELAHVRNVQSISSSARLFGKNSLLPITPSYPGLEAVTAALVRAGGFSVFSAGVIVVAVARVMMMLALFLFYERASGSPRIAGVATLVYTATPTFLYFSAQFSYESLALPLAAVALFALMRWGQATDSTLRRRWGMIVIAGAAGVVPTHHITSYFVAVFLVLVCLVHWWLRGRRGAPWGIALAAIAMAVAWLVFVAGRTVGYLSPVFTSAVNQIVATINRESSTRPLFTGGSGGASTPLPERAVAVLGVLVLALGILAGVIAAWRQRRIRPVPLLLLGLGVAYVGTLPLRFVPAAWETASRAGEFLFIGVGLTVASGAIWLLEGRRFQARRWHLAGAVAVTLVFASGAIAGWASNQRLARPLHVRAAGHTIEPPALVAATWIGQQLGPNQVVAAQNYDARYVVDYGRGVGLSGTAPPVVSMLDSGTLQPFVRRLLRRYHVTLVFADRRKISADNIVGGFFDVGAPALYPVAFSDKFDTPKTDRILAGGQIVIYRVRGLW